MDLKSTTIAVFVAVTLLGLVQCQCQTYPCLQYCTTVGFDCRTLVNNSFIRRKLLKEENGVLKCVTNNMTACSSKWFIDSEERQLVNHSMTNDSYYADNAHVVNTTNHCEINLKYRRLDGINVKGKIFRCDIQKSEEDIESLYGRKGKHCTFC